jgi:AcrR family transcriptional regulator
MAMTAELKPGASAATGMNPGASEATGMNPGASEATGMNPDRRSRGDRQRDAIVGAVRELLQQKPFSELSVSMISERAGVARSGFYFYFDSKYSVLAHLVSEATEELEELTQHFGPRAADETPAAFAKRMVGSAVLVYAHNDPVMAACYAARSTDAEIRELLDQMFDAIVEQLVELVTDEVAAGTAHPITEDIRQLVRMLAVTSAFTFSEPAYVGPDGDVARAVAVLERLWLSALWSGSATE